MSAGSKLDEKTQEKAFGILLDGGLRTTSDDRLLVIHDESLAPYLTALIGAIIARDIPVAFISIPKQYQNYLCSKILSRPESQWLPMPVITAINTSTVILNLLDGDLATARVRRAVIEQPRTHDCRLAHIPGISDEILSITGDTNFEDVYSASELTAWALGNGNSAELVTFDINGGEYRLRCELGGWDNEPLMSPGTILAGSWGNFPPGETFCCPEPSSVQGKVCISGSVPDQVLQPGEEVVLEFKDGGLSSWTAVGKGSPALAFFNRQKLAADGRGDGNWNTFCELGIGLNAAISKLTGNSLFDEKVARTVHVAIGDNTAFGHNIQASIHADMVAWNPTLTIDGMTVIDRGLLCIDAIRSIRDSWSPRLASINESLRIRLKEAEVKEDRGILKRRLCKGSRIGLVQMAGEEKSAALATVARLLSRPEPIVAGDFFREHPKIGNYSTPELVSILRHYKCVLEH